MAKSPQKKPPWAGGPGGPKDQPMGISYAAATGTLVNSAAKNGTLGAQPSPQVANQIVFDTAITTNNGQLAASPTFVGRLVILRLNQADEETRYITAVAADNVTCTVSEDWVSPPQSGDTYHISYLIIDADTLGGVTLLTKRNNDYAIKGEFIVGNGTAFAFFALLDGASMELDNNNYSTGSSPRFGDFNVRTPSRFQNGYELAGAPVSGGYMVPTSTGTGSYLVFYIQEGAQCWLNDFFMSSVWEGNSMIFGDGGSVSPEGWVIINRAKFFRTVGVARFLLPNMTIRDTIIEGLDPSGVTQTLAMGKGDFSHNIESLTFTNFNGITVGSAVAGTSPRTEIDLPNITWVNMYQYMQVLGNGFNINMLDNSGFNPPLSGPQIGSAGGLVGIDFNTYTDSTVREQYSYRVKTTLPGTGASANGRLFVYDYSTTVDGLVIDSDTNNAPTYQSEERWTYRDLDNGGAGAGSPSIYDIDVTQYGPFATQILHYGYVPQVYSVTSNAPYLFNAFMVEDALQTGTIAAALAAVGSPEPTITRHGTGETDTRPMKFMHIVGFSNTLSIGDTVIQSGASTSPQPKGTIVALFGDIDTVPASNGWALVDNWSGEEFLDGTAIFNGLGFVGVCDLNTASPAPVQRTADAVYQEYTMEVNANGASLEDTYRFILAALAENPHTRSWTETVLGWMRDEQPYLLDYQDTNSKFQTHRNTTVAEGVFVHNYGAGGVNYFTADDGTTWTPPATATVTFTNLQPNTEVRLFRADTMEELGTGTENSGTSVDVTYPVDIESPLLTAYAVLFNVTYEPVYIYGIELDGTNQTFTILQRFDRVYANPE